MHVCTVYNAGIGWLCIIMFLEPIASGLWFSDAASNNRLLCDT